MFGKPSAETKAKIAEWERVVESAAELKAAQEREKLERAAAYERQREADRRRDAERMGRQIGQPAALVVELGGDSAIPSREKWRAGLAPEPVEIPSEPVRRLVWDEQGTSRGYADDPPDATRLSGGHSYADVDIASYAADPHDPAAGMKLVELLPRTRMSR
jgi:hypothetical protein